MDYKKIYSQLIQKRLDNKLHKNQGTYLELHHIVPTSLGGSDDQQNKINLTAREHYIAHLLLYKMQTDDVAKFKMFKALVCFKSQNNQKGKSRLEDCKINSRLYESIRINTFKNFHPKNKNKGKLRIKNIETGKIAHINSFDKLPVGYEYVSKDLVEYNGQMMHYIEYENIIFSNAPNKIHHRLFVMRLNNGWTLEEATTIDVKFGSNKQNYISALELQQKKLKKKQFIIDSYNDFKTLSKAEFNKKYTKKQKHYLLKHFRTFSDYMPHDLKRDQSMDCQ